VKKKLLIIGAQFEILLKEKMRKKVDYLAKYLCKRVKREKV